MMQLHKNLNWEEILAGMVLGELSDDEFRELGNVADSASAGMVKDLEKIAALAAWSGVDPSDTMPDKLRLAITAAGRALVSASNAPPAPLSYPMLYCHPLPRRARTRNLGMAGLPGRFHHGVDRLAKLWWEQGNHQQSLIASARTSFKPSGSKAKLPLAAAVTGDVVWSNSAQARFMSFVGLPINDPTLEQYQLWIIDPSRDDEPIDGGVFNITSRGQSIVPIQAKLTVGQPKAFAITIVKPGGVVVSTQERLPLLAMVP